MEPKKSKPVKRCSPNQQAKRVQSCKIKITGQKLENSDILTSSHAPKTKGGTVPSRSSNDEVKQRSDNNATAGRKDRHAHNTEPKVKAKCNRSMTTKTSVPNESNGTKTKSGNTRKSTEPKSGKQVVEIKTRTRTIIPVKFTSM